MIRFTNEGVFADTEEERLAFYDRMHLGDPVIIAHLELYKMELAVLEDRKEEKDETTVGR